MSTSNPAIELYTHQHCLRTAGDLAKQLKVSRNYLTAMRFHGFNMPGGKASLVMAHEFINSKTKFAVRARPLDKPLPLAASCGKANAPATTNGRRKPSSATRRTPLHTPS